MGDVRSRQDREGLSWLLDNIQDCVEFLTVCWVFLMLTVFPLYAPDGYHEIGGYKFSFFSGVSALFLVPGTALALVWQAGRLVEARRNRGGEEEKRGQSVSVSALDACMCVYLVFCLVSFGQSGFKKDAWAGAGGWNMGLHTRLAMIASYYLISRHFPWKEGKKSAAAVVICGALTGSGITFALGVLHRFGIDPLGFYRGIDGSYQIRFLSTIGQATWYSSYVCTVFPIGLCLFYASRRKRVRLWSGLYCVLGFMTLVTQNSDSAFAALGFLFLGLFVASCRSMRGMERFLECLILCAASFRAVGFLQWGFMDRAMELGRLSMAFSRGSISWILLLAGCSAYFFLMKRKEAGTEQKGKRGKAGGKGTAPVPSSDASWEKTGAGLRRGALWVAAVGIILLIMLIALNTAGLPERWFGLSFHSQYLFFDDKWGSNRGFIWKTAAKLYADMPLRMKLFGAGPDCFMAYSYSIPEYAKRLNDYWKPDILTNAHNEFLNLLICEGLAGMLSWIALLLAGIRRFYQESMHNPPVLAGMLTICAYAAHNFFCYQQVCCTPFLFLIIGLAEGLTRKRFGSLSGLSA